MTCARRSKIGRTPVSYHLDPTTVARLTRLSNASGLSRGRVLDLAVKNLAACHLCGGEGHGKDIAEPCDACDGARLVIV
jgi:hypothetical protein